MSNERQSVQTLNRTELTRRLVARLTHEEAVIGGIGNANFDMFAVGHRPQNFYMLGSMGATCPIALGVALAQPQRGVLALEGDGSILMALGCLATIANSAWVRDEAHFETLIDRRFDEGGPVLIGAKIDDQPAAGPAVRDPALIRNRFMKGLGTSRGGVLDA